MAKAELTEVVSVDWCEDEEQVALPWDAEQWIKFRRLSARDRRRRSALGGKIIISGQGKGATDEMIYDSAIDKVKEFEWTHCIVAFRLKDSKGNVLMVEKNGPEKERILNHVSAALERFIEENITRINKEDTSGEESSEVKEAAGNSEDSSD